MDLIALVVDGELSIHGENRYTMDVSRPYIVRSIAYGNANAYTLRRLKRDHAPGLKPKETAHHGSPVFPKVDRSTARAQ